VFDKLKTYMLEREIRSMLERYYWQFGLTLEEAKRLPMQQLMERLNDFLADKKTEVGYYASVVQHLDERIQLLSINNEEMKHRMRDMQGENKGLHKELATLREENYKLKLDNTLLKQAGFYINKQQEKTLINEINSSNYQTNPLTNPYTKPLTNEVIARSNAIIEASFKQNDISRVR
jgi:predicted RNase H-like nuclease (RuvC/YqgF family)